MWDGQNLPLLQTQASVLHEVLFRTIFWKGLGRTRTELTPHYNRSPAVHQMRIILWSWQQMFLPKLVSQIALWFLLHRAKRSFTRATPLLPHRNQCTHAQHNLLCLQKVSEGTDSSQLHTLLPAKRNLKFMHLFTQAWSMQIVRYIEVLTIIRVLGSETPLFNVI